MSITSYKFVIVFVFVPRYIIAAHRNDNSCQTMEDLFEQNEFPKAGDLPILNRKVFRGTRVAIAEHPYVVSVRKRTAHYLIGTLLTKNLVLTVAHPLHKVSPCELAVVVGENYADRGTSLLTVLLLIFHQDFSPYTLTGDIALLRIYEDIGYKVSIKPISLASGIWHAMRNGYTAFVTGWGRCDRTGTELCLPKSSRYSRWEKFDPMLRSIKFTLAPSTHCDEYVLHELKLDETMLCVGPARVDDMLSPCMAVPGAPLVVDAQLAGMLSWGFGCGYLRDLPLVYTNIEAYLRWLVGHIPVLRSITKENLTDLYLVTKTVKAKEWLQETRVQYTIPKTMRSDQDMQPLDVDYKLAKLKGVIYDIRDYIDDGKFHDSKVAMYQFIKQSDHRLEAMKEIELRTRVQGVPFMSRDTLKGAGFKLRNGTLLDDDNMSSENEDEDEDEDDDEEIEEDPTTTPSTAQVQTETTLSNDRSDSEEDYQEALPVDPEISTRVTLGIE